MTKDDLDNALAIIDLASNQHAMGLMIPIGVAKRALEAQRDNHTSIQRFANQSAIKSMRFLRDMILTGDYEAALEHARYYIQTRGGGGD